MKDIVERLHTHGSHLNGPEPCLYGSLMCAAADEIERLRAALTEISNNLHGDDDDAHVMAQIAREALKGGGG